MKALYGIILALFFVLLGLMSLILPWSVSIRTEVVDFLLSNTITLTLVGISLLVMGLGVLIQILHGLKRRYVILKGNSPKIDLNETIFQDYLNLYFEELFPNTEVPCRITLKRKSAKVKADLPYIPTEAQEALLKKIENDLSDIFRGFIGWRYELLLAVSFAPLNKKV